MDYKKMTAVAALAMGASMVYAQDVEIATWSGFRKGAASFTFDDGAPSHVSDAGPLLEKYEYRGTFNLVVNWNPDWNGFQGLADKGHEIASHSNSHGNNMSGEEASSKKTISDKIQQKYGIITVAYPNCNVPNKSAVLSNYIAGRICGNGQEVMSKEGPSDWAEVPAIMTGSEPQYSINFNSASNFTGKMQEAVQKNGWIMFLTHGLEGKSNGSATFSPTSISALEGALQWAQQNDKDIWVAPMGHVAMYLKERKASKAEASASGSSITVKLTHSIKDDVCDYDYPLSLRVKSDMAKPTVKQGDASLEATVDGGYIYFDAVPNAGDIVISAEGAGPGPESSSSEEANSSSSEAVDCTATPDDASCNTGIASTIRNSFQLAVFKSSDGYIVVSGAKGMNIAVFNSLGHQLRSTRGLGAEQIVFTGAKGVYIVKVGGRTWKVKL